MNLPAGRLLLIPTPLDHGIESDAMTQHALPLSTWLSEHTLQAAANCSVWICENAKSARLFLKRLAQTHSLPAPLQELVLLEMPREMHKQGDHRSSAFSEWARRALEPAIQGQAVALVCEAGMPAIADPGSSVVRQAHRLNIRVIPHGGPSSLIQGLAASGLNGQSFAFNGYLPLGDERIHRIRQLDAWSHKSGQSQICIETPYRNQGLLEHLLKTLQSNSRLAVAVNIATPAEKIYSAKVQEWRNHTWAQEIKGPAVFMWGPDSD